MPIPAARHQAGSASSLASVRLGTVPRLGELLDQVGRQQAPAVQFAVVGQHREQAGVGAGGAG